MKKGILFLVTVLVFLLSIFAFAQSASPVASASPAATAAAAASSGSVFSWLVANYGVLATVLLGISESLALLFPSSTGFGGILATVIGFLKKIGANPPAAS